MSSVLDVGCGTGILRDWLPRGVQYIGLDRSVAAIAEGHRLRPTAILLHASAEDVRVWGYFDAVVFNEMLYYCPDPVGVFDKYASLTNVVVCSIYQHRSVSWRRRIANLWNPRHPRSAVHCEELIRQALPDRPWRVVADSTVADRWHVWCLHRTASAEMQGEYARPDIYLAESNQATPPDGSV